MHINLIKTLADFLDPLAKDLARVSPGTAQEDVALVRQCGDLCVTLDELRKHSTAFVQALGMFAATQPEKRAAEKLRSATTNLVRANESFKKQFSALCPEATVRNHPLVGCLYGYQQPRTATLDKAALVAQETMIDIWSLDEEGLEALTDSAKANLTRLGRTTDILASICTQLAEYEAVA
ncbi:MAG: hypothetical protein AB8B63_20685 [Granulosicoccus sp.]